MSQASTLGQSGSNTTGQCLTPRGTNLLSAPSISKSNSQLLGVSGGPGANTGGLAVQKSMTGGLGMSNASSATDTSSGSAQVNVNNNFSRGEVGRDYTKGMS